MALFCSFLCFKRHTGSFLIANILDNDLTRFEHDWFKLLYQSNGLSCFLTLSIKTWCHGKQALYERSFTWFIIILKDCWLGEKERFVLNIYFCSLEKRIRYQFLHTLDNISWRHQYQCHSDVCSCVGCDIRCLANLDPTSAAFGDVNVVPTGRHSRHYFQLWSWKAIQTCVT